jgi:hypothetical protein
MTEIKPKKTNLPADAKPYKNLVVTIEDARARTSIWLEMDGKEYRVRKVKEPRKQRH